MATVAELNTETNGAAPSVPSQGKTVGQTIDQLLAGEGGEGQLGEVAEEATEKLLDQLLTKGFDIPDTAVAGAAFAYALADGWSLGALDVVMGLVGLGDEVDQLRKTHPTISTAGDVASFLSPGVAAKLFIGATRLGVKGIARGLVEAQFRADTRITKRTVAAMEKFYAKHKGYPTGEGLTNILSDILKISKPEAKELVTKYKIDGRFFKHEVMDALYGGIPKVAQYANKFAKAAQTARNTDKALDTSLKVLKRLNIDPVDAIQVTLTYQNVKQFYLDRGRSEEDANGAAMAAAISFAIGKGLSTQVVDRILGNVLVKGQRTGHQLGGLFRYVGELGAGLFLFNLGNIEDAAKEAVGGAAETTADVIGKNMGGMVMPMMSGPMSSGLLATAPTKMTITKRAGLLK